MSVPGRRLRLSFGSISRITKLKAKRSPLGFKLVKVTIGNHKLSEITSCIVEQVSYEEAKKPKSEYGKQLEKIIYNKMNAASRAGMEPQQIEVNGTMIAVIDAINVEPIRRSFYGLPENEDASRDAVRKRYERALKELRNHEEMVFGSGKVGLLRTSNGRQA